MLHLVADRVQILNSAHRIQNLNSVRSSSTSKETTTTQSASASRADVEPQACAAPPETAPLVFPKGLSLTDSERRVLALRLEALPGPLRQNVLDEAAGRILAKRRTADPVRCESRLCGPWWARALKESSYDGRRRASRQAAARTRGNRRATLTSCAYSEAQRVRRLRPIRPAQRPPAGCSNLERK
jgi:hypothetical protein